MSDSENVASGPIEGDRDPPEETTPPAVGIVAGERDADATMRAILRARERGHPVLLACSDSRLRRAAEQYCVGSIDVSGRGPDRTTLRTRLVAEARTRDYPGIIVAENPREWIDYDRSSAALSQEPHRYSVSAHTVSERSREDDGPILAAIPAYNEADTVADVVTATERHVDTVLVVDDGSHDETAERAREAGARVIEHRRNRGYGAAIKTALRTANRRDVAHMVLIDGDGQHDPTAIPKLVAVQRTEGAELVIGSRFGDVASAIPLYRRAGLGVINRLVNASFRVLNSDLRVRDTQSGFRSFDRDAIQTLAEVGEINDRMGASLDILYQADRHGLTVREVDTEISYDDAEGTHHPIKHGFDLVGRVTKTVEGRRPLLLLGLPGGVMTLAGLVTLYSAATGLVPGVSVPVAVIAMTFALLGAFALTTLAVLHGLDVYFSGRDPA